ncbi:MAG: hypothetical protein LBK28_05435, partial [Propionibacteriaceae bacterium]|nr:hypothetical protein [Propionibacteriaceae bacterium]
MAAPHPATKRPPLVRSLLLAIGLILGSMTLTGCGTDPRASAIEEIIASYQAEHPEVYKITVVDIEEQLKDFSDEKQFSMVVQTSVTDPSQIDINQLLPSGKALELTSTVDNLDDDIYLTLRNEARSQVKELVDAMPSAPTAALSVPMTLVEEDGKWIAAIDEAPTDDSFDATLVSSAMVRSTQWTQLASQMTAHIWKELIFPDAGIA